MANLHPAIFLLVPIPFGALLIFVTRRDRRRKFIENRLNALAGNLQATAPSLSLAHVRERAAQFILLPQRVRVALETIFEATGNSVRFLHLPLVALIAAVIVFGFTTHVLSLKPTIVMSLTVVAALLAPVMLLVIARSRYQKRFLDVFPDALDLVSRGVKAGLPVNESLLVAGKEIGDPAGKELRRAFDQVQIGIPMIDALEATANRVGIADFRFMVVALSLQSKTGGSLAETLNNLSGVIRARKAVRLKARSLSAEAKVSAMILAGLPFVIGGLMYLMNRDLMQVLFTDQRGKFMVGIAFVSLVMGVTTMTVMIKRAIR